MRLGFTRVKEHRCFVRVSQVRKGEPGKFRVETRNYNMDVPLGSRTKSGNEHSRQHYDLEADGEEKLKFFLRHLRPFLKKPGVWFVDDDFKVVT